MEKPLTLADGILPQSGHVLQPCATLFSATPPADLFYFFLRRPIYETADSSLQLQPLPSYAARRWFESTWEKAREKTLLWAVNERIKYLDETAIEREREHCCLGNNALDFRCLSINKVPRSEKES